MITLRSVAFTIGATLILLVGVQASTESEVVTSHVTNMGELMGPGSCLAGIAGVVRQEVKWFNDQPLINFIVKSPNVWVYAVESTDLETGQVTLVQIDPTEEELIGPLEEWTFPDPNGAPQDPSDPLNGQIHYWTVYEYKAKAPGAGGPADQPDAPTSSNPFDAGQEALEEGEEAFNDVTGNGGNTTDQDVEHLRVWAVNLYGGLITEQTGTPETNEAWNQRYNFVLLVDTCDFRGNSIGEEGGNETFKVDLFVGSAPRVQPPA